MTRPGPGLLLLAFGGACIASLLLLQPGLRGLLPSEIKQVGRVIAARVYLNLGLQEVARARVARDQLVGRHLEAAEPFLERAAQLAPGDLAVERGLALAAVTRSRPAEVEQVLERLSQRLAPDDSNSWFQVGRLYRQAGNVEGAIAAWSRVNPSTAAWSCSGPAAQLTAWSRDQLILERWETSVTLSRAAIRLDPANPTPYPLLVSGLRGRSGDTAAHSAMREQTRMQPNIPWAYAELAKLEEAAGQVSESDMWQARFARVRASPAWITQEAKRIRACSYD